jgi:hypothetical protein
VNSGAPEGLAVPAPLVAPVVLINLCMKNVSDLPIILSETYIPFVKLKIMKKK